MISNLTLKNTFLFSVLVFFNLVNFKVQAQTLEIKKITTSTDIMVGAQNTQAYLPLIKGKKVGILTNQTGIIKSNLTSDQYDMSVVDYLLNIGANLTKIYAPEHGFRGTADAGELIKDGKDIKTGLPIISLYGNSKKPSKEQLKNVDVMLFDLQDVGARFYTYISSLHYVMEACAENNIPVIILDRPNPNISIIDGPTLELKNKSFVGMHPIPIMHGMTIGEYGQMINGQKWLANNILCDLTIIPVLNYTRESKYNLPIAPSPNLPNQKSINLYPSLCFFEGTNVSSGRGTDLQFQIYGSPNLTNMSYSFTPRPNAGAKNPMNNGKVCHGENLSQIADVEQLEIKWLLKAYANATNKDTFFNNFFIKLAGTTKLKQQIVSGTPEEAIRKSWEPDLQLFKTMRQPYLIY
ncbi:exo-beta-N-acetylmuramidase NamZ family protein [Myroides pelagicus]|uniref:DUF1343 domain-containing protein n=1 Tax=Myroides pelagicus TaxID=270914 RepID=A0A7K1GMH3_9FLAO|nr:DUF1343 domain-containing protein [Myroides pelagicus]MTH30095.1 DUF1343 domain-containing protein [Myroides pelagicus]